MPFILEEVLKASDIPTDLKPHVVYQEVIEGLRAPLVFASACTIDRSLIGHSGTKVSVPVASQLTASTITEASLTDSGYSKNDKTITDVDVTIGNEVYAALYLSDILMEDVPNIDWVRLNVRNMAKAVLEYQDGAVRDVMIAGAGNSVAAATFGTLDYDDLVDAVATMEGSDLFPEEPAAPFWLIVNPNNAKDIVKDTRFTDTKRYALHNIPFPAGDVGGLTCGCRVFKTSQMTAGLALIVAPPNHSQAPFVIKAIKRPLTLKTERREQFGKQMWVTSMRYGSAVIQSTGVYLITGC